MSVFIMNNNKQQRTIEFKILTEVNKSRKLKKKKNKQKNSLTINVYNGVNQSNPIEMWEKKKKMMSKKTFLFDGRRI